jgi:hypothetical protein
MEWMNLAQDTLEPWVIMNMVLKSAIQLTDYYVNEKKSVCGVTNTVSIRHAVLCKSAENKSASLEGVPRGERLN